MYLVLDCELIRGVSISDFVRECVAGGVSTVQLREKTLATRDFMALARQLAGLLKDTCVPLIINDRVDVALASGADGVHLGQTDMSVFDARKILGNERCIGLSLEKSEYADRLTCEGADYVAASPVFPTATKTNTAPPWGLAGLRQLKTVVSVPLIAIGGITAGHVPAVLSAGADGIAVVSALCAAAAPRQRAAELRRQIEWFRFGREAYGTR